MYKQLLFFISVVLLLVSCTRFDSTFDPPQSIDFQTLLFGPLQEAFVDASASNLSGVMSFYDDDYLHNGQTKSARELFFRSMYDQTYSPQFTVTLLASVVENDTLANTTWRLRVYSPEANKLTLLADSTFTGEKLIKRNGTWKLWGNRISCFNPPVKQRVVIESFTFVGCPNCPPVEQALHDLQTQYPMDFSYIEYHIGGPFNSGAMDVFAYYGYPSIPTVVVQGLTRLVGNSSENLALYQTLAQNILQTNAEILLTDLLYTYTPGVQIAGSVKVTPVNEGFDTQNLRLKYVLLERERSFGSPPNIYRNIVMKKGDMIISGYDLTHPIAFTLPFDGVLPDDAYLLVYVQRQPAIFASDAQIYNGLEIPVSLSK